MYKCYLCGTEDGKTLLHEGIHKQFGIVKVCRKCYHKDKMPLIEKKELDMVEVNRTLSVRERLAHMAHVDVEKKEVREIKPSMEDVHLRDLVEKNFKREVELGPKRFDDLVDNFNWVIMRKRRIMKLTRTELANAVLEPSIVIESLEGGSLPRDYVALMKKIENHLGIRLLKRSGEIKPEEIIVESRIPSGILISEIKNKTDDKKNWLFGRHKEELYEEDLDSKKVKKEVKETVYEEKSFDYFEKENVENKSLDELSDDDINDLIWGKK